VYVGRKRIIVFIALAYGISWAFWIIESLLDVVGTPWEYPFIILAVFGPAIAAIIVQHKKIPLLDYVKNCFIFEQKIPFYAIFAAFFIWRFLLMMTVGSRAEGSALYKPLLLIPICLLTGGFEELGWRGFLQPQMEKKMHAVPVAFIFTAVWTVWHLPLFFLPIDPRGPFDLLFMLGFFMTNAFTMAAIYKLSGSVLLCVFFHAWGNALSNVFIPAPTFKTVLGFSLEWLVSMIILILCEKGVVRPAKEKG